MNTYTQTLLTNSLEFIASNRDERGNGDKIAQAVLNHGIENLGGCLAVMTPKQIMSLVKKTMKGMVREVHYMYQAVENEAQRGVQYGGVDSTENAHDERGIDGHVVGAYDRANEAAKALDEVYINLNMAFLAAEKVVMGWKSGYQLKGLPYFYSQNKATGTWNDVFSFDEARVIIARDWELRKEAETKQATDSLSALADLTF